MKPLHIKTNTVSRSKITNCELWDVDKIVAELNVKKLPISLVVNGFEKIVNLRIFIDTNAEIAKHNNSNHNFKIYYDRLVKLNDLLSEIKY